MPVLTGSVEMQDLAKQLAKMRIWRAKWYAYSLDKHSHYDMFRVSVGGGGEYHTRLSLPTRKLRITFVEHKEQVGNPNTHGLVKMRFRFIEARVDPLPAPAPEPSGTEYFRAI